MTVEEFTKLLDEFGGYCNTEGFTGSENAGDCANDCREQLIEAFRESARKADHDSG